jgi:hypothetical protein
MFHNSAADGGAESYELRELWDTTGLNLTIPEWLPPRHCRPWK